jgi:hypothetical protein
MNLQCSRCQRRFDPASPDAGEWNATLSRGVVVGGLCPGCQTAHENAEAQVNEATLTYKTDGLGRVRARPKGPGS